MKSIVRCVPPPPPTVPTGITIDLAQVPGVDKVLSTLSKTLRDYRQVIHRDHDGDIVVEDANSIKPHSLKDQINFGSAPDYSYKIHFHRGFFSVNMKLSLYQVMPAANSIKNSIKRLDDENKKQANPTIPPQVTSTKSARSNYMIEVVYETGEKPLYYDFTQYLREHLDYSSSKNVVSTMSDLGHQFDATLAFDAIAENKVTNSSANRSNLSNKFDQNYAFYSIPSNQGYLVSLIRMISHDSHTASDRSLDQIHEMEDKIDAIHHLYSMVKTGSDSMLDLLHSLGLTRAILSIFDQMKSEGSSADALAQSAFLVSLALGESNAAKEMIRSSKSWRTYFRQFTAEQTGRVTEVVASESKEQASFSFEEIVKGEFNSGFLQTAY